MKSILLIGLGRFGRHIAQELNDATAITKGLPGGTHPRTLPT